MLFHTSCSLPEAAANATWMLVATGRPEQINKMSCNDSLPRHVTVSLDVTLTTANGPTIYVPLLEVPSKHLLAQSLSLRFFSVFYAHHDP